MAEEQELTPEEQTRFDELVAKTEQTEEEKQELQELRKKRGEAVPNVQAEPE